MPILPNNMSFQTSTQCTSCKAVLTVDINDDCSRITFQDTHFGEIPAVTCLSCDKCIGLIVNDEFQSLDNILREGCQNRTGWQKVEGESDRRVLFTLSQIIYKEYEVPEESQLQTEYSYPPLNDLAKLLWINGTAVGFYTVKHKGTLDEDYMDWYTMTVLDTLFIRALYRRQGYASTAVQDLLIQFPDEDIGFSQPISIPMQKVLGKHLELQPQDRPRFWEITGCGSEGNCRNLWLTLRRNQTQVLLQPKQN